MSNQSKPTSSPSSHWEVIDESLMKYTYGSDQAMYPAPLLTYDRLRSWVESCPELCIVLRRGHDDSQPQVSATTVMESVLGTIIVIPLLRKYWNRLTGEGKPEIGTPFEDTLMQEHDVDPSEMFPSRTGGQGSEKAEVGLHVFHIERFTGLTAEEEGRRIGFTQLALEEVRGRVGTIFPSWSVMGYSAANIKVAHHLEALTVTSEGNMAFKRSGFLPTYMSSTPEGGKVEMMIRKEE